MQGQLQSPLPATVTHATGALRRGGDAALRRGGDAALRRGGDAALRRGGVDAALELGHHM